MDNERKKSPRLNELKSIIGEEKIRQIKEGIDNLFKKILLEIKKENDLLKRENARFKQKITDFRRVLEKHGISAISYLSAINDKAWK